MTPPRTRRSPLATRPPGNRPGATPTTGVARSGLLVAGILVALGGLVLAILLSRGRWFGPRGAPDPTASLDPAAALREGTRLGSIGEYARSLPYLRRARRAEPGSWEARFNLASSLANTALQVRRHLGHDEPVLRSSADRLAMLGETQSELASAIAAARTPHEAALATWAEASLYESWGLPLDALAAARRAQALDPAWPVPGRLVVQIERDFARADSAR